MADTPRRYFLQYHNARKLGWVPLDDRPFLQTALSIYTRRPTVRKAVGGTVFVIVGLGPARYYLWECFRIDGVEQAEEEYCAWGTGWQLVPPQPLTGEAFEAFHRACAYFIGFRCIDDQPYLSTLVELAQRFRADEVDRATEGFCTELLDLLPGSGDAWFHRGHVRWRLGDRDGARADLDRALALGGEYREAAERCRREVG